MYGSRKIANVRGHLRSLTIFSMTISSSEESSLLFGFEGLETRPEGNHVDSLARAGAPS